MTLSCPPTSFIAWPPKHPSLGSRHPDCIGGHCSLGGLVCCETLESFLRAQPQVCFFTHPTNSITHLTAFNKSPSAETSLQGLSFPQANLDWYNQLLEKKVWNSLKPQVPLPWEKRERRLIKCTKFIFYWGHQITHSGLMLSFLRLSQWRAVIIQEVTEIEIST